MNATPIKPDIVLTDEALLARFAPIFRDIEAESTAREQSRDLLFDAVARLQRAGFGALRVPAAHGGGGASLSQFFRLLITLAAADSNLPQIVRAHFGFVEGQINRADPAQQKLWFGRIVEGALFGAAMAERSRATEIGTILSRRDDHWQLDGVKYYSTGTIYATWIAVVAVEGEERVSLAVPTTAQGVTIEDDWAGFGQRMTGSGTTRFNQVRVTEEQVLHRSLSRNGFADGYLLAIYQLFHLATLAGIARAVLRDAIAFTQAKTRTFDVPGVSVPRQDPLVQRVIGRLSSIASSTQAIVEDAVAVMERAQQGRLAGAPDTEALDLAAEIRAFEAQQIVIDLVLQATTLLFDVGGASATSEALRLDRHWRNARVLANHNPAIQRERAIGDYRLNGVPPTDVWKRVFAAQAASQTDG